jgi:hypothetical protein
MASRYCEVVKKFRREKVKKAPAKKKKATKKK